MSWRSLAACAGTELDFFPERTKGRRPDGADSDRVYEQAVAEAVAVCETCVVLESCYRDAVAVRERHGIRGGRDWSAPSKRRKVEYDRWRKAAG